MGNATPIESAGGIVIATDETGQIYVAVVQGADGKWRIPKGHRHQGESLTAAAVREVTEEVGLSAAQLSLGPYLGCFEHNEFDPAVSKINHFYLMRLRHSSLPHLKSDSAHEQAVWARFPAPDLQFAYAYQRKLLDELQANHCLEHYK